MHYAYCALRSGFLNGHLQDVYRLPGLYGPYGRGHYGAYPMMRKGAEEARNQLPDLLAAAEKGRSTIITRRGRPIAALVPIDDYASAVPQEPLSPLAGSGRGLWGKNSTDTVRQLRDEWDR